MSNEGTSRSILPVSSLDRRLLKAAAARQTPEQMSEAVLSQLTPAQAVTRVKDLIASKDVWTEAEERQLLMYQMQEHLDYLRDNRDNGKVLASIPRMFKIIADALDRSRINLDEVANRISATQARIMVAAIDAIVSRVVTGLIERGVDVQEDVIWAEVEEAMPIAIHQIEGAVPEDE